MLSFAILWFVFAVSSSPVMAGLFTSGLLSVRPAGFALFFTCSCVWKLPPDRFVARVASDYLPATPLLLLTTPGARLCIAFSSGETILPELILVVYIVFVSFRFRSCCETPTIALPFGWEAGSKTIELVE